MKKKTFLTVMKQVYFFRALPEKTMCLKNEACKGGTIPKERLTVLLYVNMIGEFETPLIIGKTKKPRYFKGIDVNQLNIDWRANSRAWMTREIMTDWLLMLDRKMSRQKRNIILFLDNASSHPVDLSLQNVKLIYLPPNTTSKCQPLDQGIVKDFKVLYCQRIIKRLLMQIDSNDVKSANQLAASVSVRCYFLDNCLDKSSKPVDYA